jgi:hypothetical protein
VQSREKKDMAAHNGHLTKAEHNGINRQQNRISKRLLPARGTTGADPPSWTCVGSYHEKKADAGVSHCAFTSQKVALRPALEPAARATHLQPRKPSSAPIHTNTIPSDCSGNRRQKDQQSPPRSRRR